MGIRPTLSLILLAALIPLSCGGESAADGWKTFCEAPDAIAGELAQVAPEMRQQLLMRHIEASVKSQEVRSAIAELARMAPAERRTFLDARLQAVGIATCPAVSRLAQ